MGFGGRGAYLHTVTAIPCQTVLGMRSVAKLGTHASAEAAASLRALARPPSTSLLFPALLQQLIDPFPSQPSDPPTPLSIDMLFS